MLKFSLLLTFTALLYVSLPVHASMPILKTGQTVSYDQSGNVTSTLKDDGYYQAGADRHYSRTDDIVTDHTSGLMWQDDSSAGLFVDWDTADSYCTTVIELGGYQDWRVPTIKELETLVDLGGTNLLNNNFQNGHTNNYWSSNTSSSTYAWFLNIENGSIQNINRIVTYGTRCVRSL